MTMNGMKPKKSDGAGAMANDDEYQDWKRNVPQPHPTRQGWLCQRAPGGGFIGWEAGARPWIMWKHIDGPLLHFSNGEMHWLTWRERFRCWMGWEDAASLEFKHRPELTAH